MAAPESGSVPNKVPRFANAQLTAEHLLATLPWGVLVLATDGTVTMLNPVVETLWGLPAAAVEGRQPAQVKPAVLPPDILAALAHAVRAPQLLLAAEYWLPHTQQWVRLRVALAIDSMVWVYWEPTGSRQPETIADSRQQLMQQQFHSLVESIPDVVTRWDRGLRLHYANVVFETTTGVPNAVLLGKTWQKMGKAGAFVEPWMADIRRVVATGQAVEQQHTWQVASEPRHYRTRVVPERDADGQVEAVLVVARDITELVQAQQGRTASEDLLLRTEQVAHTGSYEADLSTGRLRFSEGMFHLFGEAPHSFTPSAVFVSSRSYPDDVVMVQQVLDQAVVNCEPYTYRRRIHRADGQVRTLEAHGIVVCDATGAAIQLLGLVQDVTERVQAEVDVLRAKEELARRATDKYHALFYTMDQGFCILEILFDDTRQQAVNFRYLETNPVFAKQSGMPEDAKGKTVRELVPDIEPFWFDTYGRLVRTGETVRVEHYVPQLSRWFDVHAFRIGAPEAHQIAVLFQDITARKHTENLLRQSEERQTFLLQLSDALRPLTDPVAIQSTAIQFLGQHLGVDRAYYVDVEESTQEFVVVRDWYRLASPRHPRHYPHTEWPMRWLVNGQTWVCHDVEAALTLPEKQRADYCNNGICAVVAVPLLKQNRLAATLVTTQSMPRAWTAQEVALVEEVAERTWAAMERVCADDALRHSEERYRAELERQVQVRTAELQQSRDLLQATMDSTTDMIQVFEAVRDEAGQLVDFRWLLNNHTSESLYGEVLGQRLLERNPGVVVEGIFADFKRVVETGESHQAEHYYVHEQFDGWFLQSVVKLGDGVATSTKDITEWKRVQAEVLQLQLSQQQSLFEAVQATQEQERKRMAESLHNGIGQLLFATKLRLDQLHTPVLDTAPTLVTARLEADRLLAEAIRQTRALSHELMPTTLEEFGLAGALQDIGHKMSTPQLRFTSQEQLDEEAAPLSPALQLALYRMAQELALNIGKHAYGATEASLELETMPGWVLLRAEDNGPGFAATAGESSGLGLRHIRDQVFLLGGQMETGSILAGGAYVRIRIPISTPPVK